MYKTYKVLFMASAIALQSALPAAAFDGTVVILEATEARLECQNTANPLSQECAKAENLEAMLVRNGYCFNHELAPWRKGEAIPDSGGYCVDRPPRFPDDGAQHGSEVSPDGKTVTVW